MKLSRKLRLGRLVICFAYGALWLHPGQMQEHLPVPIDPTQVFPSSDLVEVIETLPLYIAEPGQVSFYDYDQAEWHTYPYPDFSPAPGEIAAADFTDNGDGTYALKVQYYTNCDEDCDDGEGSPDLTPPRAALVRERWHFDLDTGQFTPFEAICGDHARALSGAGEWVVISLDGEVHLCNTESGQMSAPLLNVPHIGFISTPALLDSPSISPNDRWLVFTFYYDFKVYVYDFAEDRLISLGTMVTNVPFSNRDYPVVTWVNQEHITLENWTSNYGDDQFFLYQADVSQPDSLELIYHSNSQPLMKLQSPARYIWIGQQIVDETSDTSTPSQEDDCTIHEYHPEDDTISSYYISDVCSFGALVPDGSGDRLARQYPVREDGPQNLIRFNLETGMHEVIPVSGFHFLAGFSSDGRYAVMTLNVGEHDYQVAVLDLQTHALLEPRYPTSDQFTYIQWTDKRTFWQVLGNDADDRLFTISENSLSVQTGRYYPPGGNTSPDGRLLLVESDHRTLDILDVKTFQTTTVAQIPDGAMIYAVWEDDGSIKVTVWRDNYYTGWFGRWRVRVHI
jgi:hypothetical protein